MCSQHVKMGSNMLFNFKIAIIQAIQTGNISDIEKTLKEQNVDINNLDESEKPEKNAFFYIISAACTDDFNITSRLKNALSLLKILLEVKDKKGVPVLNINEKNIFGQSIPEYLLSLYALKDLECNDVRALIIKIIYCIDQEGNFIFNFSSHGLPFLIAAIVENDTTIVELLLALKDKNGRPLINGSAILPGLEISPLDVAKTGSIWYCTPIGFEPNASIIAILEKYTKPSFLSDEAITQKKLITQKINAFVLEKLFKYSLREQHAILRTWNNPFKNNEAYLFRETIRKELFDYIKKEHIGILSNNYFDMLLRYYHQLSLPVVHAELFKLLINIQRLPDDLSDDISHFKKMASHFFLYDPKRPFDLAYFILSMDYKHFLKKGEDYLMLNEMRARDEVQSEIRCVFFWIHNYFIKLGKLNEHLPELLALIEKLEKYSCQKNISVEKKNGALKLLDELKSIKNANGLSTIKDIIINTKRELNIESNPIFFAGFFASRLKTYYEEAAGLLTSIAPIEIRYP